MRDVTERPEAVAAGKASCWGRSDCSASNTWSSSQPPLAKLRASSSLKICIFPRCCSKPACSNSATMSPSVRRQAADGQQHTTWEVSRLGCSRAVGRSVLIHGRQFRTSVAFVILRQACRNPLGYLTQTDNASLGLALALLPSLLCPTFRSRLQVPTRPMPC